MLQFYLSFGRTQNFQVFSPPVTAYAVTAPSSEGAFALMYFLDRLRSADPRAFLLLGKAHKRKTIASCSLSVASGYFLGERP